jgi:hypothetical protein
MLLFKYKVTKYKENVAELEKEKVEFLVSKATPPQQNIDCTIEDLSRKMY